MRVATYTGDLERLSAGVAIAQLQHVVKHNVVYLDGGWQVLVEALRERATRSRRDCPINCRGRRSFAID